MVFRESDHSYIHQDKRYTSCTTLYGQFKKKKDWYEIAEKYAAKNGETAEYWLDVWNTNKEQAAEFGSAYHLTRELGDQGLITAFEGDEKKAIDLNNLEGTYKELIVWTHEFEVAGQIDKAIITDNKVRLRDYKTCKEIETEPKSFFKKGLGKVTEKYLPPISHLAVFNLNDFALQMSLYGYMLELYGYEIESLVIEHIKVDEKEREKGYKHLIDALGNKALPLEHIDYEVPYLRDEARAILTHHKNSKKW